MIDDTHMIESLRDQVSDYANRLTRALRTIDRMHEELNRQEGSIHALHDMIQDCWGQFAVDVDVDGEVWLGDGALSTLENVSEYLVRSGHLVKHPTMYVYRRKP